MGAENALHTGQGCELQATSAVFYGDGSEGKQDPGELHTGMEASKAALRSVERRMSEEFAAIGIHATRSSGEQFCFSKGMVSFDTAVFSLFSSRDRDLGTDCAIELFD